VGSRSYPFNRLFEKVDTLVENGLIGEEVFGQIGTTTYRPRHFTYTDFLQESDFIEHIHQADLIISHGASGSIMKALNAGKKVIAVTRLEKYGEHINDHQIQNNEAFAENKLVWPVYEMDELDEAIRAYQEDRMGLIPWINKDPMAIINVIDDFIRLDWDAKKTKNRRKW
jgi:UDP-N-acetylglucosamine transferase subunit ALG13